MRYDQFEMLPIRAFRSVGGRMTLEGGKGGDAPDYTPLAQASKESAEIMAKLGGEQLDFAKQQYSDLSPALKEIANKQIQVQDATLEQAAAAEKLRGEVYEPLERQLAADAGKDRTAERAAQAAADEAERKALTASNEEMYQANKGEVDTGVNRAIADTQGGFTRTINQIIRQGSRYGAAPANIVNQLSPVGLAQASATASAANNARTTGTDLVRGRLGLNRELRLQNENLDTARTTADYAKKLDVAGVGRNLSGVSNAAYGLSANAGNSAAGTSMAAGNQYMAGLSQGANTIGSGRNMLQSGLTGVLNAQTSAYNADQQSGLDIGGLMQGGAALYKAFSDRRLKENIVVVGVDPETSLTLYEFNYIKAPGVRYRGVMADEVENRYPDAVMHDEQGYAMVDYSQLGLKMVEVSQ